MKPPRLIVSPLIVLFIGFAALRGAVDSWPGEILLPTFPKENPAAVFSELKIYDANRSPLRVPREDWNVARMCVAKDEEWSKWLKGRRNELDRWIEKHQDRVEWTAGWWHDFVSPSDGSFLTFTPDEPGELTLSSPSDPQVKLTPKLHAAWVYGFRGRHIDKIVEAARMYRITGDAKYIKWAAGQIDFYADNFEKWPLRPSSRLMWQSLDEAVVLVKFITAARLLGDEVTQERRDKWREKLFEPQVVLLESSYQFVHNIACWHRAAIGMVALYFDDADLWDRAVESPHGIRAQIHQGVTSDYLWYEQSLHYNDYVVTALRPFLEYAWMKGRGAALKVEAEIVENLLLAPLYLRFPNDQLPNPADGNAPRKVPNRSLFAESARIFPTAIGLAEYNVKRGWDALLDPLASPKQVPRLPEVISSNLESSRMAIVRKGGWQVFFHYGQLSGSHNQAEALSYELFHRASDISHDPGSVGYGSAMINDYYRAGVCHMVPLVDGMGQNLGWRRDAWDPGVLEHFSASSVAATQPQYRPNANARRSLVLTEGGLEDVVSVATSDGQTHDLGFMFLFNGAARLSGDFSQDNAAGGLPASPGFKYWHQVQRCNLRDRLVLEFVTPEGVAVQLEILLPGSFTAWHASVPDYPPKRREAVYVQVRGEDAKVIARWSVKVKASK